MMAWNGGNRKMVAVEIEIHRYVQNISRKQNIHDCQWPRHAETRGNGEAGTLSGPAGHVEMTYIYSNSNGRPLKRFKQEFDVIKICILESSFDC